MDVIFTQGAGLAGHQQTVMACRATSEPTGQPADGLMEGREFGTLPCDLLALADWLAEVGIMPVARERTGEYWKPVQNILEGDLTVFLVNAAHVKQVPGRQTEKAEARWLAKPCGTDCGRPASSHPWHSATGASSRATAPSWCRNVVVR